MENTAKLSKQQASTCFAKGTWLILGFAILCLAVDAYAICQPHHPSTAPGELQIKPLLSPAMVWALEIALAVLSFWLIRFALSREPRIKPAP